MVEYLQKARTIDGCGLGIILMSQRYRFYTIGSDNQVYAWIPASTWHGGDEISYDDSLTASGLGSDSHTFSVRPPKLLADQPPGNRNIYLIFKNLEYRLIKAMEAQRANPAAYPSRQTLDLSVDNIPGLQDAKKVKVQGCKLFGFPSDLSASSDGYGEPGEIDEEAEEEEIETTGQSDSGQVDPPRSGVGAQPGYTVPDHQVRTARPAIERSNRISSARLRILHWLAQSAAGVAGQCGSASDMDVESFGQSPGIGSPLSTQETFPLTPNLDEEATCAEGLLEKGGIGRWGSVKRE